MLNLTEKLKQELLQCALRNAPFEMCGAIVEDDTTKELRFMQVKNVHADPKNSFTMDYLELDAIETYDGTTIVAYAHSHPSGTCQPSATDRAQCNLHNKPYVIVGTLDKQVLTLMPNTVPLLGREYVHVLQDCYSLVRDYYLRELGITIPDYARDTLWWENAQNESLYEVNFKSAGFVQVPKTTMSNLKRHDVLITRWGNTAHPNHALIYLGSDGQLVSEASTEVLGDRLYLHHLHNAASCRTLLGESKFMDVALVLRHESLL